ARRAKHGNEAARVILPVIWSGAPEPSGETTHWPIVLDFDDPEARDPLDLLRINRTLGRLSEPVRQALSAAGRQEDLLFQLNSPLRQQSIAAMTSGLSDPPRHTPDGALKDRLASGAPLVVMAVIDDGLPFAHRNFLNRAGNGTRVEFCWLQSSDTTASETVAFGREFTRDAIDKLVAAYGPDEDAIYARAGAVESLRRHGSTLAHRASHGSHVMDAAAGLRPSADQGDLDLMRIIAVQLPAAITADTTGFRKDAFVLSALHYIFERADAIAAAYLDDEAAPLPLVVNFSYGFTGGPHDGSDRLEVAIARLIEARQAQRKPTTLVMPSGNSFGDRMNGEIPVDRLRTGMSYPIPWRLQPNDRTSSYLEIWLPAMVGDAPEFDLRITEPRGIVCQTGSPLTFTCAVQSQAGGLPALSQKLMLSGKMIGLCVVERYNDAWLRVVIALAPTEPGNPALPAAPSGRWTIALSKTEGSELDAPVACRIQRDNDPFGYLRGARQSYFDDDADLRFTADGAASRIENPPSSFVRRLGSLNGLATHDKVLVVAGCYGHSGRATEYGAAGPLRKGADPAGPGDVRLAAISDESTALRGVLAAGTRSGSVVRLSGTSMAAPKVARLLAMKHISQTKAPGEKVPLRQRVTDEELSERPTRLG
ncbi:MAG: hypothetical protein U0987_13140, partial [Afipia sp.]|nr:hypothetical protein [Afipia sp.]